MRDYIFKCFSGAARGASICATAIALIAAMSGARAEIAWQANGVPVCEVTGSQESPNVAGVGSGQAIVVWADTRELDYDIYAQKFGSDGSPLWTAGGVKICGAIYDQQFPAVVGDGAGGGIVVWQDGRLGDDGLSLYAQRVLPDGTLAWQADGLPVCSYPSGLTDPPMAFSHAVTSDGNGGVIVAWRDTRNDPVVGNTEIYAQGLDGSGIPKWTLNGVTVLGFAGQKWATRNPIVAPDGTGGVVVAWQDARSSATSGNDLYIQHISSTGAATWSANGVVVCNAVGDQGYPDIQVMAAGATAIVWEDKRSGSYDIYAQQFSPAGSPQWGDNGRLVCSSINDQRTPRVCPDGADGLVTAWTDKRNSTLETDVYAQRLNNSGMHLWENQGKAVCTAPGSQTRIRMAASVSGSTILTWMDNRNETTTALYDIYGQMIDSAAEPQWSAAGIPVAAITGSNQRLQLTAGDDSGNLFAVWEDNRNAGDWDVFAQKLTASAPGDTTPPGPVTGFTAAGSSGQIVLNWTKPVDADLAGIRILYKTSGYPASATDGTVCYDGTGTSTTLSDLVNQTRYYCSAFAYDSVANYSTKADALAVAAEDASIILSKTLADGQVRYLRDKIVTAAFFGYFYVQEPDALHGIRVVSNAPVAPGNHVDVVGTISGAGSERYIDAAGNPVDIVAPGSGSPHAVCMSLKSIGGDRLNALAPGVAGGSGANNLGLLVRVYGKVTQTQTGTVAYFYLNDGSAIADGTKTGLEDNVGVRAEADSAPYLREDYVMITGIASCFDDGAGNLLRKILPLSMTKLSP